ncbi:sensor histidine kinase [Clostridium oryzae]|uniref:histidine kinase n=1 Tax=Clostridium oryzae TaxID=1450648 RepID=A0A1V4IET4_9CLOT|nr:HAMP domain-containing sensor histidine kinase [Clostridium oryzae]OPJ58491.1 sensor protein kinase WalK [Clostridium oryzae]
MVGILVAAIIILLAYIAYVQVQIRCISKQLDKRLKEHTRQPISIELFNSNLNKLAANINKSFKTEEELRLNVIRNEKEFKELIANISHDLRTPLTAIKGYQQLMDKGELSDKQRKNLSIANKHAEELGQLIEHFFEYSYILNMQPKLQMERINLTNLVTECIIASVTIFEDNGISVNFEETPPIFICADREKVTRIIQNLIRNCVQHSGGEIKVKLSVDTKAVISFQNPIKESPHIEADKIFERFYTGDKARSHSTGLGLSIVKLLAEQMGGSAYAELNGEMLDIRVTLPMIREKRKEIRGLGACFFTLTFKKN